MGGIRHTMDTYGIKKHTKEWTNKRITPASTLRVESNVWAKSNLWRSISSRIIYDLQIVTQYTIHSHRWVHSSRIQFINTSATVVAVDEPFQ